MGLLDRIQDMHDSELLARSSLQLEADRMRSARIDSLNVIIKERLNQFAGSLGEVLTEITPGSAYVLGDIVLTVELFERGGKLPDPENPQLALTMYLVKIVGIDTRSGARDSVRLGTLKFLSFDGLRQTVIDAPGYLNFSADLVRPLLPKVDSTIT